MDKIKTIVKSVIPHLSHLGRSLTLETSCLIQLAQKQETDPRFMLYQYKFTALSFRSLALNVEINVSLNV